jgi:hypothetical protein
MRLAAVLSVVAVAAASGVSAASSAVAPQQFCFRYAHAQNAVAYRQKFPWRFVSIGCVADGEAVYLADAKLVNVTTHAYRCYHLAIGQSYNGGRVGVVLASRRVRCGVPAA